MKKSQTLISTVLIFLVIQLAISQYTTIPDVAFEQLLITQSIDSEGTLDGKVLISDLTLIVSVNISSHIFYKAQF
ncbi:hypothetical protein [Bizionia myxarmorum]|uniref:Uncharacterized protein n=1 Tax=Bizionia myxarmorum TaxID=291186 RepID=A0A5D0RBF7_9FLAO|nr:hypothetical protein [Bizionia myxarmorum]TYB78713.1 hypothetical protein ES674_02740 [Bizionia myxarmorum]